MLGTSLIWDFAGKPTGGENDLSLGMEANSFPEVSGRLVWQDRYSRGSRASYEHLLERPQDYDKILLWTLFTLTSTIAAYTCPPALVEDFLDCDFV